MPETSTAQGRYFVLNSPVASPGQCGVCGYGGNERLYLDPRLDFEFYGSLILCEECVASMARLFNFIEPAQALALEARVEEAERELIQLRAAVAAVEAFRVAVGASSVISFSGDDPGSSIVADDPVTEAVDVSSGTLKGGAESSVDAAEPAGVEGRNDLRDSDTSDDGLGLSL